MIATYMCMSKGDVHVGNYPENRAGYQAAHDELAEKIWQMDYPPAYCRVDDLQEVNRCMNRRAILQYLRDNAK